MISSVRFLPHRNTTPLDHLPSTFRGSLALSRELTFSQKEASRYFGKSEKEFSGAQKGSVCRGDIELFISHRLVRTPHSTTIVETKRRASRCEHFLAFTSNREPRLRLFIAPHYLDLHRNLPRYLLSIKETFDLTLPPLL